MNDPDEIMTVAETAEIMTVAETAEYLRVPVSTIRAWRLKRTGPRGFRAGKYLRYRRRDVDAWADGQAVPAA